MSELERFIAEQEKSPDLAAVTRYHLEGLKRALERCSQMSRAKALGDLLSTWCHVCGGADGDCECEE